MIVFSVELCQPYGTVQTSFNIPEVLLYLESTVEAAVGTGSLRMDIEGRRLLRHHSGQRLAAKQNINNQAMVPDQEVR